MGEDAGNHQSKPEELLDEDEEVESGKPGLSVPPQRDQPRNPAQDQPIDSPHRPHDDQPAYPTDAHPTQKDKVA